MKNWAARFRELDPRVQYGLLLAVVLLFPLIIRSSRWVQVANYFWVYALLGLSLNIILGYAGLFQLGHAAFYAVGAYTVAILNTRFGVPVIVLIPLSGLLAAIFGVLISRPILHLRGDYLCIVTIGFGEIVRIALRNLEITGGPNGIFGIGRPSLFGITLRQQWHYYYLFLGFVVLTVFAMKRLEDSRLGRAWLYVREDELAAEAMGVDTVHVKLLAFALGAAWAGVVGGLYASWITVIAPESFSFWESVVMFCIVVLGGTASIPGVFVGTIGMIVLPELLRDILSNILQWRMLVFGAAMIAMMIFRPEGLWPSQRFRREIETAEEEAAIIAAGA